MKRKYINLFFIGLLSVMPHPLQAGTLSVPVQYATLKEAAAVAQDGDEILIEAGEYTGTGIVATLYQNNIAIRGVNGRAHLNASGVTISNGKAILVIGGSNVLVENIEFSNTDVPDDNGAGIRYEGEGSLTVRNCYFHNNENGLLTGNKGKEDITVEFCEFRDHRTPTLLGHNIYIGNGAKFTMIGSYSHDAYRGHNVKSRAKENYILYNRIADTPENVADKGSSYLIDIPQGGLTYMIGNEFNQLQKTENPSAIAYSKEDNRHPLQVLYFINNTVVNDKFSGDSYALDIGFDTDGKIINNIFDGFKTKFIGNFIGEYSGNIDNATFVNRDGIDYHLQSGSNGINTGINPGTGSEFSLTPTNEYVHPLQMTARSSDGQLDVGAFEFKGSGYALSVAKSGTGNGTVSSNPSGISCGSDCSESYTSGQSVTLTATPAGDSTFASWSGVCTGTVSTCTVSMTEAKSVTAIFTQKSYTVTPTAGTGGSISPNAPQTVVHGATKSFTVTANTGYSISSVSGCGGSLSGSTYTTGAVTANCTVTASFAQQPATSLGECLDNTSLIWTTGGSAAWSCQSSTSIFGGSAAQSGEIVDNQESWVETAVTGPGTLRFYWKVSSEGDFDHLIFFVDGFEQSGVTKINGEIDWTQREISIPSGTHALRWVYAKDISLNSGTDAGWLDKVEYLLMNDTYTVIPSAGTGGTISPNTPQTVASGATTSFTITPNTGYVIDKVEGCDGTLSENIYTTNTITANCTVIASFAVNNTDTDDDGLEDGWELYWFGDLTTANARSDYDKDGYSDLQEYLNNLAGESDPDGGYYDPTTTNAPGGAGYRSKICLPAIYMLLL